MNGFEFCRKRAGLTQKEAAEAMNVTQASICAWETGRSFPTGERVLPLANLYQCEVSDLYAGTEKRVTNRRLQERREMREFAQKYGLEER